MTDLSNLTDTAIGAYWANLEFLENKERIFALRVRLYELRLLIHMSTDENLTAKYLEEIEKDIGQQTALLEAFEAKGYYVNWNLRDCLKKSGDSR